MKVFTESNGIYLVTIPTEWEYKNVIYNARQGDPNSFELYNSPIGCFQINCKPINAEIGKLISANNLKRQSADKTNLDFIEKNIVAGDFAVIAWMAVVEDNFFLIKYIYQPKADNKEAASQEIEKARNAVKTIMLTASKDRDYFIAKDRFDKFMMSIVACIDLRNRAYEKGAFIELVILIANQIDAQLRIGLILKSQLEESNEYIDIALLHQKDTDKAIMERAIYKQCFEKSVISQSLFDELESLYKERNKVVHRYIITDLRTQDILTIVIRYGELQEKIDIIINTLEAEQHRSKIGIYATGAAPGQRVNDEEMKRIISAVNDKHGNIKQAEKLTIEPLIQ